MSENRKVGRAASPDDAESLEKREDLDQWQREVSQSAIEQIRYYRDMRGISNDELRERLDRLGWRLTKDSLASLLAGKRRTMPWADLLLFAQALAVPVLHLAFPIATNERVRVWPHDTRRPRAYRAFMWAVGKNAGLQGSQVAVQDETFSVVDEYLSVGDLVTLQEEADEALDSAYTFNQALLGGRDLFELEPVILPPGVAPGSNEDREARRHAIVIESLVTVREIRSTIRNLYPRFQLPPLPKALAFLDEQSFSLPPLPIKDWDPRQAFEWIDDGSPSE